MAKKITDLPVKEFSCFCASKEDCVICNKPIYLVEQIFKIKGVDEEPEMLMHRMEGKSDDYIEGFMDGLRKDFRTDKIFKNKL